jgi:ribonuclease-3
MTTPKLPDPLPELPYLDAAIALDVYAHRSLHYEGKPVNEEYGDNRRLAILGEAVLNMAVTQRLFYQKPLKTAEMIEGQRQAVTSDAIIHQWVEAYKMQSRLAFAPSALEETKTEAASRFLLTSYIGAVYYRYGLSPIKAWIDRLIEPDDPPVHSNPPQPSQLPPAIPQSPQHTHHINPAQGNALAMFNQTLQQNGMTAEWPAESSGPPHALRWSVRCLVNGVEKGKGSGRNQKLAREEAAKVASVNMGFTLV